MIAFAKFALLAVVDGQQDPVADFPVLVLDLFANGQDLSCSFMAKDSGIWAKFDLACLEAQISSTNARVFDVH